MDKIVALPSVGLFLISMLAFFVACFKDPGYTKNPKRKTLMNYYEKYRGEYICAYCEVRKPRHTRHCHYCKRCVKVNNRQEFDHHCPWIHNCVGKNNHFWFMVFITFAMLDYMSQIAVGILDYLHVLRGHDTYFYELRENQHFVVLGVSFLSFCFLFFVFPVWIMQIINCVKFGSTPRKKFDGAGNEVSRTISELSDTGSMFARPSSDWNPASFQNQTSFLFAKKKEGKEGGCC